MEIKRDIGSSVFTWTDVVTGITGTRTEYALGTAATSTYSGTEVAWKDGTITLAQSSASTGTTNTVSLFVSSAGGASLGLYATINNVLCAIAVI